MKSNETLKRNEIAMTVEFKNMPYYTPYQAAGVQLDEWKGMTGCQKLQLKKLQSRNYWDDCAVTPINMGAYQVRLETLDWGCRVESTKIFNVNRDGRAFKVAVYKD